jgi:hypothetical protein
MLGHVVSIALNPQFFYLLDAGRSVRAEYPTKEFGEEITEHLTIAGIIVLLAVSTGQVLVVDAAYPNLAPLRTLILVAARASPS